MIKFGYKLKSYQMNAQVTILWESSLDTRQKLDYFIRCYLFWRSFQMNSDLHQVIFEYISDLFVLGILILKILVGKDVINPSDSILKVHGRFGDLHDQKEVAMKT